MAMGARAVPVVTPRGQPPLTPFVFHLTRFLNYALGRDRWSVTILPGFHPFHQIVEVRHYYGGRDHVIPRVIREDIEQIGIDKVPAGYRTTWRYHDHS